MNEEKALEEMSRLAGTQTEKNLRAAFAGEAQAHVKYNHGRLPISLKKPQARKELMLKSGSGSWGI